MVGIRGVQLERELYQNNYSKDLVAFDSLFDHAIEDNLPCQSGAGLIYRHYFIWFGLNISYPFS